MPHGIPSQPQVMCKMLIVGINDIATGSTKLDLPKGHVQQYYDIFNNKNEA